MLKCKQQQEAGENMLLTFIIRLLESKKMCRIKRLYLTFSNSKEFLQQKYIYVFLKIAIYSKHVSVFHQGKATAEHKILF